MKHPARLFLGLAALVLSSCAKENKTEAFVPAGNLAEAQAIAAGGGVDCQGESCSPSVGMLAMAKPEGAYQCTASLIGSDLVVTNSHCVPEDLKSPGSSCAGRIWLHFPEDYAGEGKRLDCRTVIYASTSQNGVGGADYAYLRLAMGSRRPVLHWSRAGIQENESLTILKMNPVKLPGKLYGAMSRVSCRAVHESDILDGRTSRSQVMLAGDCRAIPGNSGSPVIGADGTLRGVLHAQIFRDSVEDTIRMRKRARLKDSLTNFVLITNFACLLDAQLGAPPADCSLLPEDERLSQQRKEKSVVDGLDRKVNEAMQAYGDFLWAARAPRERLEGGQEISARPGCVKAGSVAKVLGSAPLTVHLPRWTVIESYDRYARGSVEIEEIDRRPVEFQFFPDGDELAYRSEGQSYRLPVCR